MIMVFPQPSRLNIAPKDCAAVCHMESPDTMRFEVAEKWRRLTRCLLFAVRVAMEVTRVAEQARALAEIYPWLAAVNPMLRESASGSGAGSSTQAGYAEDAKHDGISYQEKCLGEHVITIGAQKGTKMKDLPERYLKWALAEARRHGDLHGGICGELSYVVAYAMVKGVGDSASSAPLPRSFSQPSSDSSASQEEPPQLSVEREELPWYDDF